MNKTIKRTTTFPGIPFLDKELNSLVKDINSVFKEKSNNYWVDMQVPATGIPVNPAVANPQFDYDNIGYLFDDGSTETVIFSIQFPHGWVENTTIKPHVHWIQSGTGSVLWRLEYRWYNNGEKVPDFITLSDSDQKVFKYSSGDLLQITILPEIKPSLKKISSFIDFKLSRIGGSDTYVGDVLMKEFDCHIQVDQPGSREQFKK